MESDSMRDGSEAMAVEAADSSDDNVECLTLGRMEERTPGVNVAGAKTCSLSSLRLEELFFQPPFMIWMNLFLSFCFMINSLDRYDAIEERELLIGL